MGGLVGFSSTPAVNNSHATGAVSGQRSSAVSSGTGQAA
ncbi:MAG: hypothetical protein IPI73_25055 [Betaproteobacteria bacterium]|nr:hypothetical protein [Betaproteobacteria bacterium]